MAYDAGGDARPSSRLGCGLSGDVGCKLDFAKRPQLGGPRGAVFVSAFDENAGNDIVTTRRVGQEFFEQISPGNVPQVVVSLDDRQ